MGKGRLEAFSDGVIAIIITIMVLELQGAARRRRSTALRPLAPVFLSYVLSFVFLGIYWNNHHHLLPRGRCVNGRILWANLHLLFWLSLVPFVTHWMGEPHFAALPVAAYGGVFFLSGVAYLILQRTIISAQGRGSRLRDAVGRDAKGQTLRRHVCPGDHSLVRQYWRRDDDLCPGRAPLAHSRSADRESDWEIETRFNGCSPRCGRTRRCSVRRIWRLPRRTRIHDGFRGEMEQAVFLDEQLAEVCQAQAVSELVNRGGLDVDVECGPNVYPTGMRG